MALSLDFSNVKEYEPPPEGDYNFLIIEATEKPASSGDSQNLNLKLEIADGEFKGQKVLTTINIQESTMFRVKEFFCAVTGDEELTEINIEPADLIGMPVSATCTHRPYDGKTYLNPTAWYSS